LAKIIAEIFKGLTKLILPYLSMNNKILDKHNRNNKRKRSLRNRRFRQSVPPPPVEHKVRNTNYRLR
jgi:hypothetical protein